MSMTNAIAAGFRIFGRSWGLALLVLVLNLALAALLAVPLASHLERDLREKDAAANMMYGFDYPWWSHWSERQQGWTASFGPEIFGTGFAFRNVDLLLRGALPLGLYVRGERGREEGPARPPLDPVILGLGAGYMLLQAFLAGGILGVFRGEQGAWDVRSLLHGGGFYFGRMFRVTLCALGALYLVFLANAPLARFADEQAREAVSETTAMAWLLGRHALLLLAIVGVSMVTGYAKAIVVLEERSSALLAFVSAAGFCLGRLGRTLGHYLALLALSLLLLLLWNALDARFPVSGYRSQLVSLALAQGLVLGRVALRLSLMAGQLALYRGRAA